MSMLLKVLGVISLIVGAISFIAIMSETGQFWLAVTGSVYFVPGFALFYGIGQLLENTEEIIYKLNAQSSKVDEMKKYSSRTQYKQCPTCKHLNSIHAGGCSSCGESLVNAKIVEK